MKEPIDSQDYFSFSKSVEKNQTGPQMEEQTDSHGDPILSKTPEETHTVHGMEKSKGSHSVRTMEEPSESMDNSNVSEILELTPTVPRMEKTVQSLDNTSISQNTGESHSMRVMGNEAESMDNSNLSNTLKEINTIRLIRDTTESINNSNSSESREESHDLPRMEKTLESEEHSGLSVTKFLRYKSRLEELLPGIEEFLSETLANEKLSVLAEQRRLFFLERLDIAKLPPTVPPREGRSVPQELLKDTEEKSGIPSNLGGSKHQLPDFAAAQREIARSWAGSNGHVKEEKEEDQGHGDSDSEEKVKVYDDIDLDDSSSKEDDESNNQLNSPENPYDDDDIDALNDNLQSSSTNIHKDNDNGDEDHEEENDYEIPVAMQQIGDENGSGTNSSIPKAESIQDLNDDVIDSTGVMTPPPVPPPLPPRRDIRFSDSGSRSSINALTEDAPPDLPYRPPLPRRSEICGRSERSDRSDPDLSGDGGSTSYESFDDEEENSPNINNNNSIDARHTGIKLPAKPKKKKPTLKMSKKMNKSRSQSQWEIGTPLRKLDNVELSGEVMHKGKLTWNRRVVAIANGCLAMYKPEKDGRPLLVVPLMGYEAAVNEVGKRGYEIRMTHHHDDTHIFSVDVKDWAYTWKEHINNQSQGRPTSSRHPIHLSRALSSDLSPTSPGSSGGPPNLSGNTGTHGSKPWESTFVPSWMEEDDYDEINVRDPDNVFFEEDEEYASGGQSFDESSSMLSDSMSTKSTSSPILTRYKFKLNRSKAFRASVKSTPEERSIQKKGETISNILRRRKREFQAKLAAPILAGPVGLLRPASTLSLTRLDWKSVLYNWSTPLDQVIMTLRRTDLNGSNSNISTGSEGAGVEETVVRPRLRSGNKVMRMGSFAFRATQFFENIGKKTSVRRKTSTSSFNGDSGKSSKPRVVSAYFPEPSPPAIECRDPSNITEESSFSSTSTGNFRQTSFNSPTSDQSVVVFSDSNSNPSVPNSPGEVFSPDQDKHDGGEFGTFLPKDVDAITSEDPQDMLDISHKGYLFIFSTFNRRRWGKRWCLVRGNAFECYRSENQPTARCELSFLLKTCLLKRAVVETNSELGLMLVEQEKGKEKITVEPISPSDMPAWVQVLMAETSTVSVPEGLEEYMKPRVIRRGSDAPSLLSLSVLKQWDMDIAFQSLLNFKDPSPEEACSPWPPSPTDRSSPELDHSKVECLTNTVGEGEVSQSSVKDSSSSVLADISAARVKKKHTTDSGFYSVKGTNSDSDGEHVDTFNLAVAAEGEEEKEDVNVDCPVFESHTYHSKEPSSNLSAHQGGAGDGINLHASNLSSCVSSNLLLSHSCDINPEFTSSTAPSSSSTIPSTSSPSTSVSSPLNQTVAISSSSSKSNSHPFHKIKDHHSADNSASPSSSPSSSSPEETEVTKEEPTPGEEYSQVLKRSERKPSNAIENGVMDNNCIQNDVGNSLPSNIMVFGERSRNENSLQKEISLQPTESVYEDIDVSSDTLRANVSSADENDETLKTPNHKVIHSGESNNPATSEGCELDAKNLTSISPTPVFAHNSKSHSGSPNGPKQYPLDSSLTKEKEVDGKEDCDEVFVSPETVVIPMSITPISLTDNVNKDSRTSGSRSLSLSACQSPELPLVEVHKPGMTEEELGEAIEKLKQKKAQLKRKRLAVHDKRQRVSSDEERLACEKEFASLERAVESTDNDIGFLQNQLDALCFQSLEAIKNSNKNKSGSKKRRPKKKTC